MRVRGGWHFSQMGLALVAFVLVIAFLVLVDPSLHKYGAGPLVLLSLCPLLGRSRVVDFDYPVTKINQVGRTE